MKYESKFQDEIIHILDEFDKTFGEYDFKKDLDNTLTLCRCFQVTIFSLLRSCYAILINGEKRGCDILIRSILEYTIDLKYIVVHDNDFTNRRFVNYYILQQYWKSKGFSDENKNNEMLEIYIKCQNYIEKEFPDIAKPEITRMKNGKKITYRKEVQLENMKYWEEVYRAIKNKYSKSWTGLNFSDRVEQLNKKLQDEDNTLKELISHFGYFSLHTHPTPYSIIPHFEPKTKNFKFEYNYSKPSLFLIEQELFLFTLSTIMDIIKVLENSQRLELNRKFGRLLFASKNIMAEFRDLIETLPNIKFS